MRIVRVTLLVLPFAFGIGWPAKAETTSCKQCRDQQKACMSNYFGKDLQDRVRHLYEGLQGKIVALPEI
jgi:hypothetical protein